MVGTITPNPFDQLTDAEKSDMLAFLISRFHSHGLEMDGRSQWWFRQESVARYRTNSPLESIQKAMRVEQQMEKEKSYASE